MRILSWYVNIISTSDKVGPVIMNSTLYNNEIMELFDSKTHMNKSLNKSNIKNRHF